MPDLASLLGFTEYEGRVYRALLQESPATAYRLGKLSGVPLSRVYEAANKLVEKGAATSQPGDPTRYAPVPPAILISEARTRAESQLELLDRELTALFQADSATEEMWIQGAAAVLLRLSTLAQQATRQVLIATSRARRKRIQDRIFVSGGVLLHFLPLAGRNEAAFSALIDGTTA